MRHFFMLSIVFMLLSACSTQQPTLTPTNSPPTATNTAQPSLIPQPSTTATPTFTAMPEPTATITLTPSPTLTPGPDFNLAKFAGTGEGKIGTLLLFDIPNLLGEYQVKVLTQLYTCTKVKEFPNRLFCDGPTLDPGKNYQALLHPLGSDQVLFSANFYMPFTLLPTESHRARPGGAGTCGPVICETEIREEPQSPTGKCEVSSCFDDCGYVSSIDTCSQYE
jgi:hypothetical protein